MKLSATIITYNEEKNIARCIKSLDFADEIIVVDSFSQDNTCLIASELGAKVHSHSFLGFGQQKNLAAEKASNEWILSIDADEEIGPRLAESIQEVIANSDLGCSVYELNRRTKFAGQWIYHGGWYPDRILRLYLKSEATWSGPHVHENLIPNNSKKVGFLDGHLNHYSFPSVKSQVETNLKYASLGAKNLVESNRHRPNAFLLLFKPLIKFIECYVIKRGFLDGLAGLIIAINAAYSVFMKHSFAYKDFAETKTGKKTQTNDGNGIVSHD